MGQTVGNCCFLRPVPGKHPSVTGTEDQERQERKGRRRMAWQSTSCHLGLSLVLWDSSRALAVPTRPPRTQLCGRTNVQKTPHVLSLTVLFPTQGLRCGSRDLVAKILSLSSKISTGYKQEMVFHLVTPGAWGGEGWQGEVVEGHRDGLRYWLYPGSGGSLGMHWIAKK